MGGLHRSRRNVLPCAVSAACGAGCADAVGVGLGASPACAVCAVADEAATVAGAGACFGFHTAGFAAGGGGTGGAPRATLIAAGADAEA